MTRNEEVGLNIKTMRIKKNISIRELSRKTGIGASTISRYERGGHDMPIDKLDLIAKALNTSVPFLMYGEEAEPQIIKEVPKNNNILGLNATTSPLDNILGFNFSFEELKNAVKNEPNLTGIIKGVMHLTDDDFQIPLFSSISCGNLSSIDNILIDTVSVPNRLKKRYGSDVFAVRARGDSMNNVILDGHIAVFAKTEWQNGDAVIVMLNKEEATLKRITKTNYAILLEPDSTNKEHKPVFIDCVGNDCEVEVIGKLVHSYCDFE